MFHIVVFDNTNEVEVVPSIWMKNGECMWPPNKTDVAKAVKLQECPGDEWKPHKARIVFTSRKLHSFTSSFKLLFFYFPR